jgi:hypothetical protein
VAVGYLHINYEPHGGSWLLTILARLNQTSSARLRERLDTWGTTPLRELGLALATKLTMLPIIAERVNREIERLAEELDNESRINECLDHGAGYRITDKLLPYEILIDIDSFLFESRSAYEIVGKFLKEFFEHILRRRVTEVQLKARLEVRIPDIRWIEELREKRILFFRETAPWIAVCISSKNPLRFELVVLRKNVKDFTDPNNYFNFEQLQAIYNGFASSLEALRQWVIEQIEELEAHDHP